MVACARLGKSALKETAQEAWGMTQASAPLIGHQCTNSCSPAHAVPTALLTQPCSRPSLLLFAVRLANHAGARAHGC